MIAPMALVRLWQERWGIAQRFAPTREYTAIFINAWVQRHAVGNTTSYGGPLNLLLSVIGSVLLLLTVTTDYSVKGQLIFAGICIVISLLLRRLAGRLAFLMVAGLAMLAGLRYLTWRIQFTLTDDYYGIPSMLLWDAELFLIVAFGLQMVQTAFPFLLNRAPRLPASDKDPYIDVVLIAHQETLLSVSQVRGWIHEFRQQDWPADRLRFFVACSGTDVSTRVHEGPTCAFGLSSKDLPTVATVPPVSSRDLAANGRPGSTLDHHRRRTIANSSPSPGSMFLRTVGPSGGM